MKLKKTYIKAFVIIVFIVCFFSLLNWRWNYANNRRIEAAKIACKRIGAEDYYSDDYIDDSCIDGNMIYPIYLSCKKQEGEYVCKIHYISEEFFRNR